MTTFFLVKENVKHNGTVFTKGEVFNGDVKEYASLVSAGLFASVEAKDENEAKTLFSLDNSAEAEVETEVNAESNTWEAKKDEVVEDADVAASDEISNTPDEFVVVDETTVSASEL